MQKQLCLPAMSADNDPHHADFLLYKIQADTLAMSILSSQNPSPVVCDSLAVRWLHGGSSERQESDQPLEILQMLFILQCMDMYGYVLYVKLL